MALVNEQLVKDVTTTTGTGSYTCAGTPPTGCRSFATAYASLSGSTANVKVDDGGSNWELGVYTITISAGVATIARTTIQKSSNSNNAVNWAAGSKNIFVYAPDPTGTLAASNNLSDVSNTVTALSNLGGVKKSGDTMTGDLNIDKAASPAVIFKLSGTTAGSLNRSGTDMWLQSFSAGVLRGQLLVGESNLWQYINAAGAIKGQLTLGDNSLTMSDGTTTRQVVRFSQGGVVKMTFNCAPPTYWTRINVTGERVAKYATASDTPEATAGSWTVSGLTTAGGSTGSHPLTLSEIPAHTHSLSIVGISTVQSGSGTSTVGLGSGSTGSAGSGAGHDHSIASMSVSSDGTWRPPYEIVVKASFD